MPDPNIGTAVYLNEGIAAWRDGHDGKVSPYEIPSTGKTGWKHNDWMMGFEDAERNSTPEEHYTRNKNRLAILDKKVEDAKAAIDLAKATYQEAVHEQATFLRAHSFRAVPKTP